ncbi:hypothetical protein [Rhizobium oryzicola]|uniref:DUF2946 domain-containing protein n=1 Tax=Rhizobium oryzicola TaxID=1232668 RepID=A0ABT8SRX5_9HYPH|nr:hypothetical protein [Rhizobium oryzicola]MDO1581156.1 hypothetical protein [Rhizobium oryzicola]
MRRIAFLMAVLAWLFQGLMPALALPLPDAIPGAMSGAMPMAHASMEAMPHEGHEAHMHMDGQAKTHCPDCDKKPVKTSCAMSFCAACMSLVPDLVMADGKPIAASYPGPMPAEPLLDTIPRPIAPPPRA